MNPAFFKLTKSRCTTISLALSDSKSCSHYQIPPIPPGPIFPLLTTSISHSFTTHLLIHTHTHTNTLPYLQPVWYLRQMCDPWLLVNKFPLIQVTKLSPKKTHPEIGSKHPLVALERNKERTVNLPLIHMTWLTYSFSVYELLKGSLLCRELWRVHLRENLYAWKNCWVLRAAITLTVFL